MAGNKIKSFFEQLLYKREAKQINQALEEANYLVNRELEEDEEGGFLVNLTGCGLPMTEKRITKTNFEAAFHEEIFIRLSFPEKMAVLMWLDTYFAERDNREETDFILHTNPEVHKKLVEIEEDRFVFNLPIYVFLEESFLPYDFAQLIVSMCAKVKLLDRAREYEKTGQLYEYDFPVLESLKVNILHPKSYDYITYLVKLNGSDQEFRTEEEKHELEVNMPVLSQEEKDGLALFLLQPYLQICKEEVKVLDAFAMRNEQYLKEDSMYNAYKADLDLTYHYEEEFLEEYLQGRDKIETFYELLEKRLKTVPVNQEELVKE